MKYIIMDLIIGPNVNKCWKVVMKRFPWLKRDWKYSLEQCKNHCSYICCQGWHSASAAHHIIQSKSKKIVDDDGQENAEVKNVHKKDDIVDVSKK